MGGLSSTWESICPKPTTNITHCGGILEASFLKSELTPGGQSIIMKKNKNQTLKHDSGECRERPIPRGGDLALQTCQFFPNLPANLKQFQLKALQKLFCESLQINSEIFF